MANRVYASVRHSSVHKFIIQNFFNTRVNLLSNGRGVQSNDIYEVGMHHYFITFFHPSSRSTNIFFFFAGACLEPLIEISLLVPMWFFLLNCQWFWPGHQRGLGKVMRVICCETSWNEKTVRRYVDG